MILGITGGTGFVGKRLQQAAASANKKVILFTRNPESILRARKFSTTTIPDISSCDQLIHLAGESILGIWTQEKRRKILESRREGTRRLVEGIAQAATKPSVLISASAIGYYGEQGDCKRDESSQAGNGFLAEVTKIWEAEAMKAEQYGVRVVLLRTGLVLGRDGGAMKWIAPLFRYGLGGTLGSGKQWMSCIHRNDLAGLILRCCDDASISGPINAVMPYPTTNRDFTTAAAHAVQRSAFLNMPAALLRLMLGDLSHLLLDSQRIIPKKALEHRFQFCYPRIESALEEVFSIPSTQIQVRSVAP